MSEALQLILVLVPLIAGAIAIYFGFRLMRKFSLPFISSYFYYLVFLYIFGAYSIIGSGMMEYVMERMDADEVFLHSARHFARLLGVPLLALSGYTLFRSARELLGKNPGAAFTIVYFVICVAALGFMVFQVIRLNRFEKGDYLMITILQDWFFIAFSVLLYGLTWVFTLGSLRESPAHERSFIRFYGRLHLLHMFLFILPLLLRDLHPVLPFIFVLFFMSFHLVPLLFIHIHLERFHGDTEAVDQDFDELLRMFSEKYEISKREQEVVDLICRGLSNQEISEALFISLQTVKDHVHRIFLKTGVKNRVQLGNLIRSN